MSARLDLEATNDDVKTVRMLLDSPTLGTVKLWANFDAYRWVLPGNGA